MELCTLSMLWLEQPKKGWNNQKRVGTTIKKWLEQPQKGWNNQKKAVGTTRKGLEQP